MSDLQKMIGIISANTIGIAFWIFLFAGKVYSILICLIILLIVSGFSIVFVLNYFEEKESKRLFTKTSPFGFANGISFFLFLFVQDDLFEVIIFLTLMVLLLIINFILIKKNYAWYKPDKS